MELHQLRYFLAVVDQGSFTAAAEAVRISQSGVSTQIQKLERELGISLLDRSARRAVLTSAGSSLVPHARSAVAAVEGVAGAAREIRGLVVGSLRVATVTVMALDSPDPPELTPAEQDDLRAGVLTDMDVIIRLVHDLVDQARETSESSIS